MQVWQVVKVAQVEQYWMKHTDWVQLAPLLTRLKPRRHSTQTEVVLLLQRRQLPTVQVGTQPLPSDRRVKLTWHVLQVTSVRQVWQFGMLVCVQSMVQMPSPLGK